MSRAVADVVEDLEFLDSTGTGATASAARTGFPSAEAMEKWLERNGRFDLWLSMKRRDPVGEHHRTTEKREKRRGGVVRGKTCTRCGEDKPLSDYYPMTKGVDAVMPYCKKCDNARKRKPNAAKINRMRARHRAVADLISFHVDEFEALVSIRLAEAEEEAESLATAPAAQEHYQTEPVRLKPGKRMAGETSRDRIDVARCPHCVKHHDRGHACPSCGATPGNKSLDSSPKPAPSGVRPRTQYDLSGIDEFNRGTQRAKAARS